MSEKEFLEKMVEIMDTEEAVTMDSVLNELEDWDSLAYVSFMSICATQSSRRISVSEVRAAERVCDLYNLLTGKE